MKGRPPKDPALAALQGNTRRQAKPGDEGEEVVAAQGPGPESFFSADPWEPPGWLSASAQEIWRRELTLALAQTKLQESSLQVFALYCDAVARFQEYTQAIAEHGATYTTKSGYRRKTPEVELRDRAANDVRNLAAELNLTPKSWISSMGTFKGRQLDLFMGRDQASAPPALPAKPGPGAEPDGIDSFLGSRPTTH